MSTVAHKSVTQQAHGAQASQRRRQHTGIDITPSLVGGALTVGAAGGALGSAAFGAFGGPIGAVLGLIAGGVLGRALDRRVDSRA